MVLSSAIPAAAENVRATAARMQSLLLRWLIDDACPLWSTHGVDWIHGGFHERLAGRQALVAEIEGTSDCYRR